ncbi:MAG: GIY-YIG nuclease family protein [Candidatus Omnitrophota bacterium]|jgi:putative endonuclease
MYSVYVLRSSKNRKRYTGFTSKDPLIRLQEHNGGANAFTKANRPFELIYCEQFKKEYKAHRREKFLKTGNGRKFLDNIIPP